VFKIQGEVKSADISSECRIGDARNPGLKNCDWKKSTLAGATRAEWRAVASFGWMHY
jgi:hypothetical protein